MLTRETTPQGTVSYTCDAAGRRTSMPVTASVTYAYDNADRLTRITQGSAGVEFSHDGAGRHTSLSLPNGIVTKYAYDAASRPHRAHLRARRHDARHLDLRLRCRHHRTQVEGTWARTGLPQPLTSATYNAASQQLTFADAMLAYDANRNLTSDGVNTYTWNARNQLVAISGASVTATFSYDGRGCRQNKSVNGTSTQFLYDGLNPVRETGPNPAALLTGLGIDEYLTRTDATASRIFLTDALGSTIALADVTGVVQSEYTYESFGATTETGSDANPFQHTRRENDGTGLYYDGARYYHPTLQRFISEDPIGFAGGDANLYAYVANNPVTRRDLLGLMGETNARFLADFFTGGGATVRRYGPGHVETREMQQSIGVQRLREVFVQGGCVTQRGLAYGTVAAYWDTVANPVTADWSSTVAQVGGFAGASVVRNPNGTIALTIPNEAGAYSFFIQAVPNAPWQSGPLRTIQQTFQWTEATPSECTQPPSLAGRK